MRQYAYRNTDIRYVMGDNYVLFSNGVLMKKSSFITLDKNGTLLIAVQVAVDKGKDIYDFDHACKTGYLVKRGANSMIGEKLTKPIKLFSADDKPTQVTQVDDKPTQVTQVDAKPVKKNNRFRNGLYHLLDAGGFIVGVFVSILTMTTTMVLIAPGRIEMLALVGVGCIIILFAVRAWMKRSAVYNRILWAMFASVSMFINLSFMLAATDEVSNKVKEDITIDNSAHIETDTVIEQLNEFLADEQETLAKLNSQYDEAVREGTIASLRNDIALSTKKIDELRYKITDRALLVEERIEKVKEDINNRSNITANNIFYALPTAVGKGRFIEIVIWFLTFAGVELTIVSSITEDKKNTGGDND